MPRRREVAAGTMRRPFCAILIVLGAMLVIWAWSGFAQGRLYFGLFIALPGVLAWTSSLPGRGLVIAPRRALDGRRAETYWTGRRIVSMSLLGLVGLFGPMSCAAYSSGKWVLGFSSLCGLTAALGASWVLRPGSEAEGRARRNSAKSRGTPEWTWDHSWRREGDERSFARYLQTRWMFVGRMCAVFAFLALPIPIGDAGFGILAVKLTLGAAGSVWLVRAWSVMGMGRAVLSFQRFPFHPGERVALTFGVTAGGTDIKGAGFTMRHLRESLEGLGRGGGLPVSDFRVEEASRTRADDFVAGVDQEVFFDVPAGAPGTAITSAHPTYWEVEVRGTTREGAYQETFLVPIYAASRP